MTVLKMIAPKFIASILLAMFSVSFTTAQPPASREYQIKAIFLFNFTQFIEWPAAAFANPGSPLVIGILGENPFGSYLHDAITGEKVNGHPLIIQRFSSISQIQPCHILFINQTETNKFGQLETILKGQSVLTVSDAPDFMKRGGMVRFFTKSNKTQLQINLESIKAANLVVSSKLLRLAEIFEPNKK